MVKLGISIVNYKAEDFLLKCLQSLEKVKDEADLDIWVVDNESSDSINDIEEKFPKVHFIKNKDNLGFGKANNQALVKINSEYVLILNPDSEVKEGTLKMMLSFMSENPKVGAASCRVEKKDGTLDWASHRGFPTPWASFLYYFFKNDSLYHLTNQNLEVNHEVDSIVGAFFLTRKEILDEVGLFDEKFFMYGEDLDLCFRIKEMGYKIMYIPSVKIIHYKGVSSGIKEHSSAITTATLESKTRSINAFYEAMIIFYKKHFEKKYPFFINWLVYLGINLKWSLAKKKLSV